MGGLLEEPPAHLTDWKGRDWTPGAPTSPPRHPNSRFCTPITQCPIIAPEYDDPKGVPISAILFGGRRKTTIPLVTEARDWQHGVFMGATLSSETTAAANGWPVGVVRRDPMAMLPFIGYNAGDYFQHWIDVGKDADAAKLPKIFYVNWFRRDEDGRFLWPGFGENSRVLKWVIERLEGTGRRRSRRRSATCRRADALDVDGLDVEPIEEIEAALRVDADEWRGRDPADRGVVRQDRRQAADLHARRARVPQAAPRRELIPLSATERHGAFAALRSSEGAVRSSRGQQQRPCGWRSWWSVRARQKARSLMGGSS